VQDKVKRNKRIDPFISSPIFDLPVGPGLVGPDERDHGNSSVAGDPDSGSGASTVAKPPSGLP
jgi:hypothetical protein